MTRSLKDQYYVIDSPQMIDDYRCFRPLEDDIQDDAPSTLPAAGRRERAEDLRSQLAELFRAAGWEGDGTINCFFVPPCFCQVGDEENGDTWCTTIYHVKQSNNGTSWLAIPRGFRFVMPEGFRAKKS